MAKLSMGYVRYVLLGGHRPTGHSALTPVWHADSIYELQLKPALGQRALLSMRGELNAKTYSSWTGDRLFDRRPGSGSGTEHLGGETGSS